MSVRVEVIVGHFPHIMHLPRTRAAGGVLLPPVTGRSVSFRLRFLLPRSSGTTASSCPSMLVIPRCWIIRRCWLSGAVCLVIPRCTKPSAQSQYCKPTIHKPPYPLLTLTNEIHHGSMNGLRGLKWCPTVPCMARPAVLSLHGEYFSPWIPGPTVPCHCPPRGPAIA